MPPKAALGQDPGGRQDFRFKTGSILTLIFKASRLEIGLFFLIRAVGYFGDPSWGVFLTV